MLKLFLILLGLISTINFAVAEEDLVTTVTVPKEAIEIIVFSNINGQNVSKTPELFPDHVGELNKNNSIELNDQQLPLKSLLNAYNKLKKNSKYKIIFHTTESYNLPVSQRNKKFLIKSTDFSATLTVTAAPVRNTFNIAFDGIFSDKYRLTKAAKIKPKEIYYFDHPMFGALVCIQPITD